METRNIIQSIVIAVATLFITCSDTVQGPGNMSDREIELNVFPDIGVHSTKFEFEIAIFEDGNQVIDATHFTFRWDWQNDGFYDTDWLPSFSASHLYDANAPVGKTNIKVAVRNTTGPIDSVFSRIYIQELIQITSNESNRGQGNVSVARDGSGRIAFGWG